MMPPTARRWLRDLGIKEVAMPLEVDPIQGWMDRIPGMSHEEMAWLWRFAPAGHPVFNRALPLYDVFKARFGALGGMSPEISKRIGWER